MKAKINLEKCDQKFSCAARFACPFEAIHFAGSSLSVSEEKCQGCGKCVLVCPREAIELRSFLITDGGAD